MEVEVVREAPADLRNCGRMIPHVEVSAMPHEQLYALTLTEAQAAQLDAILAGYFLALTRDEAEDLRQVLSTLGRCAQAWRVWELTQRINGGSP